MIFVISLYVVSVWWVLWGGINVTSINVVWWASVEEFIGCLMTTSPGLNCAALSNIFGSSKCIFSCDVLVINGMICWHTV